LAEATGEWMNELTGEKLNIYRLKVWSGIWSGDIMGPCFIAVTVSGQTDHETWRGVVLPELEVSRLHENSDIIR
jgi:hypothetical protein